MLIFKQAADHAGIALDEDEHLREEHQVKGNGSFDKEAGVYRLHARCRYLDGTCNAS